MKLRTHIKKQRHILTTSGKLSFSRYILIPSDEESAKQLEALGLPKTIAPMDEMLQIANLPFNMTVAVMLDVAFEGATSSSYKEATERLRKKYFIQGSEDNDDIICTSRVREVTNYIGKIVFLENCHKARRAQWEFDNCQITLSRDKPYELYLMTDGASLNTRTKEKQQDGRESSWKENKLGVVFRSSDIRKWTVKREDNTEEVRHCILKKEYTSYTGSVNEFKWHLLALALRNGYANARTLVIVSDGSAWITEVRRELFPEAVHILDLFHLKENVHSYVNAIFKNKAEAEAAAKRICDQLEDGKWKTVLKELEQYKDISLPDNTVNLITYIDNHKDMLDYPLYRERGYFVGSGIIESGHKIVLQVRLDGAGMRWNVPTARYVLALREKIKSEKWESDVVLFVTNLLITLKTIPPRLPRSEKEVKRMEEEDISKAIYQEKKTWKKKRKR